MRYFSTQRPAKQRLLLRHGRTLHGFNCYTDHESCILGTMRWAREGKQPDLSILQKAIEKTFNCTGTAKFSFVGCSYGGDYLECPHTMRGQSGALIDFVRTQGYRVRLQTHSCCVYQAGAANVKFQPFSVQASEEMMVKHFKSTLKQPSFRNLATRPIDTLMFCRDLSLFCDTRLWCTEEGKEMARRLKAEFPKENQENGEEKGEIVYGLVDDPSLHPCEQDFPLFGTHKTGSGKKDSSSENGIVTTPLKNHKTDDKQHQKQEMEPKSTKVETGYVDEQSQKRKSESKTLPTIKRHKTVYDLAPTKPNVGDVCYEFATCQHKLDQHDLAYHGLCRNCFWYAHQLCCLCGDEASAASLLDTSKSKMCIDCEP